MKKIIFIADYFVEQHLGGAEINDNTLIELLKKENLFHSKINSNLVTKEFIINNLDKLFVISNFAGLNMQLTPYFALAEYVFYEHDYKFLTSRNPIKYPDFIAPKNKIINYNFYLNAKAVICLSKMHREIFEKNLNLKNYKHINCSLFSDEKIDLLLSLNKNKKTKDYAIVKTNNPTKRMPSCIAWCKKRNLDYDLISHPNNSEFLKIMSNYKNLVFMTGHPEPTPRIAVEAKLMGVKLIANKKLIGVANEYWWNWETKKIAKELKKIRTEAIEIFKELSMTKTNKELIS